MNKIALTIAGSDPSCGAGIQADLKTFQAFNVYGTSVITLITAQNSQDFLLSESLSPKLIDAQIRAVLSDMPPNAAKLGALGCKATLETLSRQMGLWNFPVVVDPVLKSTLGGELLEADALDFLKQEIFPHGTLLTPNLEEAQILTGIKVENLESMKEAAVVLSKFGAPNILITGGHLEGDPLDLLYDGKDFEVLAGKRISGGPIHGTGCTFSAAITALLASGLGVSSATSQAKRYVELAISGSLTTGKGIGILKHDISA